MATIKPILPSRGRAALLATACLVVPLNAGETAGGGSLAAREAARRSAAVEEAQMLLQKGDEAYKAGRYPEAVDAYAGARDLLPDAPATAELRNAATERFAQASVEKARGLSRKGDVAGAKATVDKVLAEGVAPNDPGALNFRSQLDDPIRTNPALTAELAKDIDEVRRLLYTAEGAYQLGKFDEAKSTYEKVLRIDPSNSAARRGMETVASAKSGYQKSAFDHARAEMLGQVAAAWETPIADKLEIPTGPELGNTEGGLEMTVDAKIKQLIVPKVNLDQVSLEEAVDFLRTIKALDGSGVNITVNLGPPNSPVAEKIRATKFSLQLANVPMAQVLKYIADATRTSITTDDYAVVISPTGSASSELISRSYRVPPDFLTSITSGAPAGGDAANTDPFGDAQAKEGLLTARLSVREALEKQGVTFPEGSNASTVGDTLRVVNTATNQDIISQLVQAAAQTEPVIVALRVTMIKVQENTLHELGFDWLVNPMGLSASTMFASGGTAGNTPGRKSTDFVSPVGGTSIDGVPADPSSLVRNLATNGLRSGDQAITNNSIDGLIANPDRANLQNVAPGIMAVTGLFSEGQAQMVMRGLNQKKGVDIMAKPAVVTRSGQQANIQILREFIYPTEYEPPELPNSVGSSSSSGSFPVTPAMPTAFETKKLGIELQVLPVADQNKRYVDITLNPSFSDFDGFVNYGSPINSNAQDALGNPVVTRVTDNKILMPVFSIQRANTQLSVANGATIAIGGLMAESIQNVEDKVPIFGSIPVIGRLFTSEAKKPVSTAVIFLVNVELMDPTGRPYLDR